MVKSSFLMMNLMKPLFLLLKIALSVGEVPILLLKSAPVGPLRQH
jgi:hypothetical protein